MTMDGFGNDGKKPRRPPRIAALLPSFPNRGSDIGDLVETWRLTQIRFPIKSGMTMDQARGCPRLCCTSFAESGNQFGEDVAVGIQLGAADTRHVGECRAVGRAPLQHLAQR